MTWKDDSVGFAIYYRLFSNKFEGIQDLFNKGRSAGIRVIASHQSLSDIAHEEKETMKRIIQANTRIKVFLSQADTESAEWFSSLVGKREVKASINL
ncbi:TraM recognition domain-containing protein [Venenivibrio stagnispumantis]